MNKCAQFARRLTQTAVLWMWVNNALRLGTGVLLLGIVVPKFSDTELLIYTVLWSVYAFVVIVDNTIGANMIRFFAYAMGGATNLKGLGVDFEQRNASPNYDLIWGLMRASQKLYGAFGIGVFGFILALGSFNLYTPAAAAPEPQVVWAALGLTAFAAGLEVFFGWWLAALRGINHVAQASRFAAIAQGIKLILAAALLLFDLGLLAVPIASLVSGVTFRILARVACLKTLPKEIPDACPLSSRDLIGRILPMCWRVGAVLISRNLSTAMLFHLAGKLPTAQGLSFTFSHMLLTFVASVSITWTQVKWPLINRYRSEGAFEAMRHALLPRIWLQGLNLFFGALAVAFIAPPALEWLAPEKSILPTALFLLLGANFLLETMFSFWTSLLMADNRLPSLWPTVVHYLLIILVAFWAITWREAGVAALVWSPLLVGLSFNYWYWPSAGARFLKTDLLRYLSGRA